MQDVLPLPVALAAERQVEQLKRFPYFHRLIGEGRSGKVHQAVHRETGAMVALKELKSHERAAGTDKLLKEYRLMMAVPSHRNVVQALGIFEFSDRVYLVQEYCGGGTLMEWIDGVFTRNADKHRGPAEVTAAATLHGGRFVTSTFTAEESTASRPTLIVGEKLLRHYAHDLLSGLMQIHDARLLHRDVKPHNTFLHSDGSLKLGDFGISRIFLPEDDLQGGVPAAASSFHLEGTPLYWAPEVITDGNHSVHSDIWAVGATLCHVATGYPPWYHVQSNQLETLILHIGKTYQRWLRLTPERSSEDVPSELWHPRLPLGLSRLADDFFHVLFALKPSDRQTCSELLHHPWLAELSGVPMNSSTDRHRGGVEEPFFAVDANRPTAMRNGGNTGGISPACGMTIAAPSTSSLYLDDDGDDPDRRFSVDAANRPVRTGAGLPVTSCSVGLSASPQDPQRFQ